MVHCCDGADDDDDVPVLASDSEDEWSDDAEGTCGVLHVARSAGGIEGGTVGVLEDARSAGDLEGGTTAPTTFAADVRLACLPRQGVPLLSVHDLDRSLKLVGGGAEVHWGDNIFYTQATAPMRSKSPSPAMGRTLSSRAILAAIKRSASMPTAKR
jgi:hypothetical protein